MVVITVAFRLPYFVGMIHFQECTVDFYLRTYNLVGEKHGKLQLGIYQFPKSCEYFAGVHWR